MQIHHAIMQNDRRETPMRPTCRIASYKISRVPLIWKACCFNYYGTVLSDLLRLFNPSLAFDGFFLPAKTVAAVLAVFSAKHKSRLDPSAIHRNKVLFAIRFRSAGQLGRRR
jgi:hypothetical protein